MILLVEAWMDIRRFAPLRAAGATWKEIAAEAGCDWRTARKYLSPDAPAGPPRSSSRQGTQPRLVDPFVGVIDGWLVKEPRLRASVIHERLVADSGFTGHYQRIKNYVRDARVRLELEGDPNERPPALHRRFETVAGAQVQVDWGDEGTLLSGSGERRKVYSFHMTLSCSRDRAETGRGRARHRARSAAKQRSSWNCTGSPVSGSRCWSSSQRGAWAVASARTCSTG